jgi:uncharacterized protein YjbJ (UPF0337 family)
MSVNKDQIKGRVEEAKGAIKEAAGKVMGSAKLETTGAVEKHLGNAQAKVGDLKQAHKA